MAAELGDADIALFVGLIVSAVVYLILGRTIDKSAEREAAAADLAETGVQAVAFDR